MQAFGCFFCKKIEFILLFYAQRWLWMLAISGREIEGLPFLQKNTRRCTYAPQDAAVNSEGPHPEFTK